MGHPVEAACTVSTTSIAFGTYDVLAASATDSTGVVTMRCTTKTTVTVQLDRGAATTFSPRTMKQASAVLTYNLYKETARTTIWGDGSGGSSAVTLTLNPNSTSNQTVFGRVPARQDVAAGAYADTIIVTIVF
jgi:spore coat protein U-like protein